MATFNSLLFLFSTLAPNMEPPVTQVPPEWIGSSAGQYKDPDVIPPRYFIPPPFRKNVPLLGQTACHLGEHPSCKYHCQKNCSNYGQDIPCPDICVFGCVCIDPFIRATDGRCIMPYECPAVPDTTETTDESDDIQCQADEEVSKYAHCQRNCTNVGQMIVCPGEGPRGCVCTSPKIRGPDGNCITSEECPQIQRSKQMLGQTACHLGEHPSCESHCQKNCANYDQNIPCPDICVLGCVCIDPFIRGPDGSCIMPYQCPATQDTSVTSDTTEEPDDIQCQHDEEISSFAHCQRNCSNVGQMIICPGEGPRGCECKSPKIRAPDGSSCIMSGECPPSLRSPQNADDVRDMKCPNKEEVSCFAHCQRNCSNYHTNFHCPMYCVTGCVCTAPLIRGPDGSCIMREQCNELKAPQKFRDTPCRDSEECDDSDDTDKGNDVNLRAISGPFDNFKFCEDKNEVYKVCSSQCPDNCENYNDARRACKLICLPLPKCECKEGFVRGPDGNCIEPEQCPHREMREFSVSSEVCPENEEYTKCGAACQKNCRDYDRNIPCEFICESGCLCKESLIRGPSGKCIPKEECPARSNDPMQPGKYSNMGFLPDFPRFSCKEYEIFSVCAPVCPDDCSNYQENRLCKKICIPACKCIEGYVKGEDGNCIKIEECEEKVPDTTPCRDSQECEDSDDTDKENEVNLRAIPGHFDDFKFCQDKNEVYKVCSSQCPDNCENYNDKRRACKSFCLPLPKCECKDGFVRGPNGDCIEPKQCPHREISSEVCSENEEYKECGTACQKNCRDYDRNIPCEFKCESGCFCKESFVRGPSGKCIPKEECPARSNAPMQPKKNSNLGFLPDFPRFSCQEYEIFSVCASICPDNCNNYQEDRLCKKICVPACKCIEGYVKGNDGKCIKKEECEEKNSNVCFELEDYKDCGSHCETDCYNYDLTDHKCEDSSCNPGCFCKTGLVRSPDGKCIPAEECPAHDEPSWSTRFLKKTGWQF